MKHLTNNNLIQEGQHGFVPGRSTQTQLLAHYKDIYEAMIDGSRIDTVFLDFAKAFDKVNHNVLLEKIVKHKIKGNIGKWVKTFLTNRKYVVTANGETSAEQNVSSGVPQGTVLGPVLFLMMISDIDEKVKACIVRSFADDTRISKKIEKATDRDIMQHDLNTIYEWAKENLMEFNEDKFEQMCHGENKNVPYLPYKGPYGKDIISEECVKDLGVIANGNLRFKEHIHQITMTSRIMSGTIMRTFTTRNKELMMMLFKSYIRSRLEYCSIVWSPTVQAEINEIERIQKAFTKKLEGMENLNYFERLKELKLYSLERRRERYMIIYAWQQIEGIKRNVLQLQISERPRGRLITSGKIPYAIKGKKILESRRTQIYHSPARKMERLFNILPGKIRRITGTSTEVFKNALDNWMKLIPDQPKIDNYSSIVAAESNSLLHQVKYEAALPVW